MELRVVLLEPLAQGALGGPQSQATGSAGGYLLVQVSHLHGNDEISETR